MIGAVTPLLHSGQADRRGTGSPLSVPSVLRSSSKWPVDAVTATVILPVSTLRRCCFAEAWVQSLGTEMGAPVHTPSVRQRSARVWRNGCEPDPGVSGRIMQGSGHAMPPEVRFAGCAPETKYSSVPAMQNRVRPTSARSGRTARAAWTCGGSHWHSTRQVRAAHGWHPHHP